MTARTEMLHAVLYALLAPRQPILNYFTHTSQEELGIKIITALYGKLYEQLQWHRCSSSP